MSANLSLENGHSTTRVAIVDDHDLARSGRESLELCSRLHPDMVLMDVRMPEMDGLTATWKIKQRNPEISVLMVTMHENPDFLYEALKAGAAGYVLKDASQDEVVSAVRRVREGESPLDAELSARLLRRLAAENSGRRASVGRRDPRAASLTPREVEVLGLMKLGHTNRQIARELTISLVSPTVPRRWSGL